MIGTRITHIRVAGINADTDLASQFFVASARIYFVIVVHCSQKRENSLKLMEIPYSFSQSITCCNGLCAALATIRRRYLDVIEWVGTIRVRKRVAFIAFNCRRYRMECMFLKGEKKFDLRRRREMRDAEKNTHTFE